MKKCMMPPKTVLGQLWAYGQSNAFTKDGLPKVSAVNYHYTGTATREEIDKIWHERYGFATYRLPVRRIQANETGVIMKGFERR